MKELKRIHATHNENSAGNRDAREQRQTEGDLVCGDPGDFGLRRPCLYIDGRARNIERLGFGQGSDGLRLWGLCGSLRTI